MDNRKWESGAQAAPPAAPAVPSAGYPTDGDPQAATPATVPGAFWFHQIGEELRAVITAAGLTPDNGDLTQLITAMQAIWGAGRPGHTFTANDWCLLPGSLILQWGVVTSSASADVAVVFPITFPVACYSVVPCSQNMGAGIITNSNSPGTTGFNVATWINTTTRSSPQSVFWLAIGK